MILPYLPEEICTDLTELGYEGVLAFWRPMDLLDKAKWIDECRRYNVRAAATQGQFIGLRRQLIRVTGLTVTTEDGAEIPFSVEDHLQKLPLAFLTAVWSEVEDKSSLSEMAAKNSDVPSGPPAPSGTEVSPAGDAPPVSETPSVAS